MLPTFFQTLDTLDDLADTVLDARVRTVGGTCGHCGSSGAQHQGRCGHHCTDPQCTRFHPGDHPFVSA
jgi:hypothetical protein